MIVNLDPKPARFLDLRYVYQTPSTEDPNVKYLTIIDEPYKEDPDDMCTCPGWKFRQTCRHMIAARADLDEQHDAH